ncbi:1-deoxy-D-xylulose-5-phosphate reductoisomerase [Rhodoblastus sphagnicola]|uniref:1-deoxy-D-xylulose 5-phosphate reductoisomerase n=1 Tax=Rhodoblastus sphagnicola TaxID=333368 RepID=A0A2S6N8D6_9HYPH|nr:1-deoxy-D-xylulose-5-phosphate reductoisomerase [Rhodoblastus sphagnicola]MBB4198174.1 1-deoxy-D-xylulose-5-phosphate reductoisomerase [Rhodoblastus sphagnicola]PPQ30868.1 1-deoxy-D-xylulose-5-phosphate reductoisomerase [Rhodoblastus sphagnicola]
MSLALAPTPKPKKLNILGATGSIGRSTEAVIAGAPGRFEVGAVASGRDAKNLARVAKVLGARFAAIADEAAYAELKAELSGSGIECAAGPKALAQAAVTPADLVVGAIAGAAGVIPTYAAVEAGLDVALANKECLVCAGEAFMRNARRKGVKILPMDSEHNAIFQALGGEPIENVETMWLTASGGPFRAWSAEQIAAATPEQALAHPNWAMGPKVTIDSASLMNKGLELIEALHIFAIPAEKLDVVVHPQSIVHGMVSFADGAVTAGMANPDMKAPIAHCLAWPERVATSVRRLDLATIGTLTFEKPDLDRFPALRVAMAALRAGGVMPTVLNAANEIMVAAFLKKQIGFNDIARQVEAVCEDYARKNSTKAPADVEEALAVDHIVRETSLGRLRGLGG